MKNKKTLIVILTFCLILSTALLFGSCGPKKKKAKKPSHVHEWATEWTTDEINHWHACGGCDEISDKAQHDYTDDHDTTCNTCGYVREVGDHVASADWTYNETHHWHACTHEGCELKFDYAEHSFADDHALICEDCEYERTLADDHFASMDWSSNELRHWHECMHEGCGFEFDGAYHTPQQVISYDETGHWYECSICGYQMDFEAHDYITNWDDTGHWQECQICGYQQDPVPHEYDDEHDDICNVCEYSREIDAGHVARAQWSNDQTNHWHDCEYDGCEVVYDYGDHDMQNEWSFDETGHWHACSVCDYETDFDAHVYDDDDDETCNICGYERVLCVHEYDNDHDATCNLCGRVRDLGDHVASSGWTCDETNHWHECWNDGCELKFDEGAHIYDDNEDTDCNTCNYHRAPPWAGSIG